MFISLPTLCFVNVDRNWESAYASAHVVLSGYCNIFVDIPRKMACMN